MNLFREMFRPEGDYPFAKLLDFTRAAGFVCLRILTAHVWISGQLVENPEQAFSLSFGLEIE